MPILTISTQLRKECLRLMEYYFRISGQLSVSLNLKKTLTMADLDIRTEYEGMFILLDDKEINFEGLREKGLTMRVRERTKKEYKLSRRCFLLV